MKIFKGLFSGAIILVLFLGTYLNAFAAGSGGGNNPLNYLGAYLTTITDNVSTKGDDVTKIGNIGVNPTIELQFSLNVAGSSVWPNNNGLIKLKDSNGNDVSISVWQIYNDNAAYDVEKRNIFIQPDQSLTPGGQYTIIIDGNLSANNGVKVTGGTQTTKFTVSADTTPPEGNGTSTDTNTNTNTNNGSTGTDTNSGSTGTDSNSGTTGTSTNNGTTSTDTSTGTTSNSQTAAQAIINPETTGDANSSTATAGKQLPNTATNMFNMLGIGILLILGGFSLFLRKGKHQA